MEPVTYRSRPSAISRGEREWRVEDSGLATQGLLGRERRLPWCEIASVRLARAPKVKRPWRHVCEIKLRNGRKIVIDNAHFCGKGCFENRSAAYSEFVRSAGSRLAKANPRARALIGETPLHFFIMLLAALLGFCVIAFGLIAFPTVLDTLPYALLIKLGIVLAMLPLFAWWIIRATPHGVALDNIPERALPREPEHEA